MLVRKDVRFVRRCLDAKARTRRFTLPACGRCLNVLSAIFDFHVFDSSQCRGIGCFQECIAIKQTRRANSRPRRSERRIWCRLLAPLSCCGIKSSASSRSPLRAIALRRARLSGVKFGCSFGHERSSHTIAAHLTQPARIRKQNLINRLSLRAIRADCISALKLPIVRRQDTTVSQVNPTVW